MAHTAPACLHTQGAASFSAFGTTQLPSGYQQGAGSCLGPCLLESVRFLHKLLAQMAGDNNLVAPVNLQTLSKEKS